MNLDRLALALALIILGYLTYRGYGWAVLRRRARQGLGIDEYRPGGRRSCTSPIPAVHPA